MPTSLFISDFAGQVFSGELVKAIADKYQVSFSACAIRYMKLNLTPIILVFSQNGKVKWQLQSKDFPFYRLKMVQIKYQRIRLWVIISLNTILVVAIRMR